MKKEICAVVAALSMSAYVMADENYSNFNLGPTVFMFKGKEKAYGMTSENTGVYCGARAEVEYSKPNGLYGALVGVYAPGAGTSSHAFPMPTGEEGSSSLKAYSYLWQVEGRGGKHFAMGKSSIVPYLACGMYHVDSSITSELNGVESKSGMKMNWAYAALGFSGSYAATDAIDVALGGKLMRHFYSKNDTTLSPDPIELDAKWGFEVNLPVNIHAKENGTWNFQAEPFYLRIDTSKDVNVLGVRLSVQKAY